MISANKDIATRGVEPVCHPRLATIRKELSQYIRKEEASYGGSALAPDTLTGHLERVASFCVRLASAEGVDPLRAELAGLFHDAGKFHDGQYHKGDTPEEEHSVEILRWMGEKHDLGPEILEEVSHAIRQLYLDDPKPTPLGRVLFDADNIDKMGLLGIANYFIKSGLRGEGVTLEMLMDLTVELTYARYASRRLLTKAGRELAGRRSAETIRFIDHFLDSLREDGLFDARVEQITVADLELDVVVPSMCRCGAAFAKKTWMEPGIKCTEIHLQIACATCGNSYKIKFCRPMFVF